MSAYPWWKSVVLYLMATVLIVVGLANIVLIGWPVFLHFLDVAKTYWGW